MKKKINNTRLQTIILNFGPKHPEAHGILKISLALSGEVILRCDPQFGLLHRGSEKLMETKTIIQAIPYLDRMDYVANIIQEHAFVQAFENCFFKNKQKTNLLLWRVVFDELSRILNHLLTIGAICLDMGAMGPMFWAFEEREQIMEIFERVSGARMHTALYQPFTLNGFFFSKILLNDIIYLINRGSRFISGSLLGLLNNKSLKIRLANVGIFSSNKINNYGVTGVIARASGLKYDLRVNKVNNIFNTYLIINIKSFLGKFSDAFDRFIIRTKEIIESFKIINQIILLILPIKTHKISKFSNMETIIEHFKKNTIFYNKTQELCTVYGLVEGPKGLVGVYLTLNKNQNPYRVQVRSPVSHNMNLITTVGNCVNFADFVATFCSLDVVLGEIDR